MNYNQDQSLLSHAAPGTVTVHNEVKVDTSITAVILAGSRDFGQCALASKTPPALWPICGKSAISRLLEHLASQGIRHAVICSNGHRLLFRQAIGEFNSMEVSFCDETLPAGTAGCIRDSARISPNETFLILSAQSIAMPDMQQLIVEHRARQSDLTIIFCHDEGDDGRVNPRAQFFVCDRRVLRFIRPKGYCDIKEDLIPALFKESKKVIARNISTPAMAFRNHEEYLRAIGWHLANGGANDMGVEYKYGKYGEDVLIAPDAVIDPTAKIFGPAIIMGKSVIAGEAVVFGPVVFGRGVRIGENSLIETSVLWDEVTIGQDSMISNCVVDKGASIPSGTVAKNKALLQGQKAYQMASRQFFNSISRIKGPRPGRAGSD
jgi:NDP-sugar pyrophosphorylase family protein